MFALCLTLVIQTFAFSRNRLNNNLLVAGIDIGLILLALWLGAYPISPLGFSSGQLPFTQGFLLTQFIRTDLNIESGGKISVISGSTIGIRPVTLPVSEHCVWLSTNRGTFDGLANCDIAYVPPANANFDLLRVVIQPSCHLPESPERLKVLVLP